MGLCFLQRVTCHQQAVVLSRAGVWTRLTPCLGVDFGGAQYRRAWLAWTGGPAALWHRAPGTWGEGRWFSLEGWCGPEAGLNRCLQRFQAVPWQDQEGNGSCTFESWMQGWAQGWAQGGAQMYRGAVRVLLWLRQGSAPRLHPKGAAIGAGVQEEHRAMSRRCLAGVMLTPLGQAHRGAGASFGLQGCPENFRLLSPPSVPRHMLTSPLSVRCRTWDLCRQHPRCNAAVAQVGAQMDAWPRKMLCSAKHPWKEIRKVST
jgi:hypothetical protein